MDKATYEVVRRAAEFAERTESNAYCLWYRIERVKDAPASAYRESVI